MVAGEGTVFSAQALSSRHHAGVTSFNYPGKEIYDSDG